MAIKIESAVKVGDKFTQHSRVVLHKRGEEWVTHLENVELVDGQFQSKSQPDFYWGHYFRANEYTEAVADFALRCEKLGV